MKKLLASLLVAVTLLGGMGAGLQNSVEPREVVVQLSNGCSGIVLDEHRILTAGHCVGEELTQDVIRDGWVYTTKILVDNDKQDFAILETTEQMTGPFAKLATRSTKQDEQVYIVGYPMGMGQIQTTGHFQGFIDNDGVKYAITTAPAAWGNSGGGLFNKDGELIGILVGGPSNGPFPVFHISLSTPLDKVFDSLNK